MPRERKKYVCAICEKEPVKGWTKQTEDINKMICADCLSKADRKNLQTGKKLSTKEYKNLKGYYRKYYENETSRENTKKSIKKFREVWPEKTEAWQAIQSFPRAAGWQLHHWSYNKEHYTDIIALPRKIHYKIHQYMTYDPERKMYRDKKSNFLLSTKALHAAYIDLIMEWYG